jgi:acetyl-CoA synthetase
LHWFKKWDKVREWDCPWAKWFSGGELNLSYNCPSSLVRGDPVTLCESDPGQE